MCGLNGVIHSCDLSKASVHDLNYLKSLRDQFSHCTIIGDRGYISAEFKTNLFETQRVKLEYPVRKNQQTGETKPFPFSRYRKRIETVFSQLVDQFMIMRNYAKSVPGLLARIRYKLCSYTLSKYFNVMNHRAIGHIKNAFY